MADRNSHERSKGLAVGAAIGAVLGVIAGILFAPKSGKETRGDIKVAALKAREKMLSESDALQKELSSLIKKAEIIAREKGSELSEKASELLRNAQEIKTELMNKAKALKAGKESDDKDLRLALKKAEEAKQALSKFLKK